jgi:hypothetical protein
MKNFSEGEKVFEKVCKICLIVLKLGKDLATVCMEVVTPLVQSKNTTQRPAEP